MKFQKLTEPSLFGKFAQVIILVYLITAASVIGAMETAKNTKKVTFDFSNIQEQPEQPIEIEEEKKASVRRANKSKQLLKRSLKSRSISLPIQEILDKQKKCQLVKVRAQYNLRENIKKTTKDSNPE